MLYPCHGTDSISTLLSFSLKKSQTIINKIYMATAVTGTYPAISIYGLDNTVHLEMTMSPSMGNFLVRRRG
jgi:hypothetical protein